MKVLRPIACTDAMLTSTTAVESVPAWSISTTYAEDAQVWHGHYIYQSLVDSNLGNDPTGDTINWVLVGSTNKWAMFDAEVGTQTVTPTTMEVVIAPAQYFTAIALLNMAATSVQVEVTAGSETLFNQTYDLDETIISDWYEYYFEPYLLRSDLVVTGIAPSLSAVITLTFTNEPTVDIKVGMVRFGNIYKLGDSEKGATLGITDYSVKETDAFGVTTFVERAFSKKLSAQVFSLNANLLYITSVLQSLRATPTVWIYSERTELRPTLVYGFARDWGIDIAYKDYSLLSLEIEGLI